MATKPRQDAGKRRTEGFDRAVGELNAFLLVLALGLAVLDATCFVAFKVRDSLPAANRVDADRSAAMLVPRAQAPTALQPGRPANVNGL